MRFTVCLRHALSLVVAFCLALPAHGETDQEKRDRLERERKAREQALFGNIGGTPSSQTGSARNASFGNRNASNLSRNLGRNSIARGLRHIRHGRQAKNRPEVRLGYFEVLQGILGLVAAANADKLSDVSGTRAENLASQGAVGVGGAGASGNAASGASGASGQAAGNGTANSAESWKGALADINAAETKEAFLEIEDEYGISRKELLDELRAGRDGAGLLENAKRNAEDRDEILAALKAAREKAERESAASELAGGAGGARSLASLSAPVPEPAPAADSASVPAAGKRSLRDELRRRLDDLPEDLEVSQEVRDALARQEAAKAAQAAREAKAQYTIFDIVRAKYAEREGMIRGWIPSPVQHTEAN